MAVGGIDLQAATGGGRWWQVVAGGDIEWQQGAAGAAGAAGVARAEGEAAASW